MGLIVSTMSLIIRLIVETMSLIMRGWLIVKAHSSTMSSSALIIDYELFTMSKCLIMRLIA